MDAFPDKGFDRQMGTLFPVHGTRINGPCRPRRETPFAVKRRMEAPGAPERIARNEVEGSRVGTGRCKGRNDLAGSRGGSPRGGIVKGPPPAP